MMYQTQGSQVEEQTVEKTEIGTATSFKKTKKKKRLSKVKSNPSFDINNYGIGGRSMSYCSLTGQCSFEGDFLKEKLLH